MEIDHWSFADPCIIKIQATWRSYKCKKKVRYFSSLPRDLWDLIVYEMRVRDSNVRILNQILYKRIVCFRIREELQLEYELKTMELIRRVKSHLEPRVLRLSLRHCVTLLAHVQTEQYFQRLHALNSLIDEIISV
jgi:hypothetical protein